MPNAFKRSFTNFQDSNHLYIIWYAVVIFPWKWHSWFSPIITISDQSKCCLFSDILTRHSLTSVAWILTGCTDRLVLCNTWDSASTNKQLTLMGLESPAKPHPQSGNFKIMPTSSSSQQMHHTILIPPVYFCKIDN